MDSKTFLQLKEGDILYYIVVENSIILTKAEVKTGVITEILKCETPYHLKFKLNNGITLEGNWNCSVAQEDIINDNRKPSNSIFEPFYFTMFSTEERELRKTISELVEKRISKLASISIDIQDELVKLAGMRIMAQSLKVKKVEELVLEPTVI